MYKRRNRLEASAHRLGMRACFEKTVGGWYMTSLEGAARRDWLGENIAFALVTFESKYDGDAYMGGMFSRIKA